MVGVMFASMIVTAPVTSIERVAAVDSRRRSERFDTTCADPVMAALALPRSGSGWAEIGRSAQERPLRVRVEGHGLRTVLWVGGIHGDEPEGQVVTANLAAAFLDEGLANSVTLIIFEDDNPDGRAAHSRTNAHGVDLNRNFPAANFSPGNGHGPRPLSEPESTALALLVCGARPNLTMVAHSGHRGSLENVVNYDGPSKAAASVFAKLAAMTVVDTVYPTPGSFGSWAGTEGQLAVLTIEYRRGITADAAWRQTRTAILAALKLPN